MGAALVRVASGGAGRVSSPVGRELVHHIAAGILQTSLDLPRLLLGVVLVGVVPPAGTTRTDGTHRSAGLSGGTSASVDTEIGDRDGQPLRLAGHQFLL